MIITLTGANSFGWQQALDRLAGEFVARHGGLALQRLDGEETSLAQLGEALNSPPFLADKKMVILRQPSANKQFLEKFEQLLTGLPETTSVVLVEPKLDKRLSYYKFLKSKTDFREFPELDTNGLARWLAAAAKEQDATLSLPDARFLVERVGTNQQILFNELQKLQLYGPAITRRTIELLTDEKPQSTIFQLLEAAFGGRTKTALKLYAEQRALKVEPSQIIAMLAWQLHVLAIIKAAGSRSSDQIAREAKINPFVVRKSQAIARHLSADRLKKLVGELLKIDIASKRTAIDADEALQHYLLSLNNV